MNYIAENFYYSLLDSLSEEIQLNIDEFKKIYPFVSGVCYLNYKELIDIAINNCSTEEVLDNIDDKDIAEYLNSIKNIK